MTVALVERARNGDEAAFVVHFDGDLGLAGGVEDAHDAAELVVAERDLRLALLIDDLERLADDVQRRRLALLGQGVRRGDAGPADDNTEERGGAIEATIALEFEVEGEAKPCCVAEAVYRYYA